MKRIRIVTLLMSGLLMTACSELNAPDFGEGIDFNFADKLQDKYPEATIHEGSFNRDDLRGTTMVGIDGADAPATTLVQKKSAPALEGYQTSFTVVQGETTIFVLYYEGRKKDRPFMAVLIPSNAQLLNRDGTQASDGDSIEITLEVDPHRFLVHFGPHGSTFVNGSPAIVQFNLAFADLEGHDISEAKAMYQPEMGEGWSDIGAKVVVRQRYIMLKIRHFSNYAVAW